MSEQGRYRKLYARIWRNADFLALSDGDRTLALYLLTGPQANRIGLFYFVAETAGIDLRRAQIGERVAKVCSGMRWSYDRRARVVWIPSWWKWNPPANINQLIGSLKDLQEVPSTFLLKEFAKHVEPLPDWLREPFATLLQTRFGVRRAKPLTKRSAKPLPNPVTVTGSVTVDTRPDPAPVENSDDDGRQKPLRRTTPTRVTDDTLRTIAQDTIRDAPQSCDVEYLVDHFQNVCRAMGIPSDRATAIRMLDAIGVMR